ncbi:MAG: acylhydrolase [Bacteroidales bacterium]|nr:acylhydrolase [Bacteroidales bacterium]
MKRIFAIAAAIVICASAHAQDWANFGRYKNANKSVKEKPTAVFMGDSITEGWANQDPDFFSTNNYIGRGISGQTSSQMLVRFRKDVVELAPKYVVILAGTNDIAKNGGDIDIENIFGNIKSMCEIAKANKIKPVICSVLPAAAYPWRPEITDAADQVMKLNQLLYAYAIRNKIKYVDFHTLLRDEHNGLSKNHAHDGVHPNKNCYKIMEQVIVRYL